ncbi:MAG: IreB family regulatory phosphoprotein [Eubacteriales bacterium]
MSERPNDRTQTFSIRDEKALEIKHVLMSVYDALSEKGYNPINQIVGYILSEDPTYITNYKNARALIRRVERDDILNELVKSYLGV